MSQEENKQNIIRFDNAQELMDYIGVSRATLYRRMNAYNMKSSKRSFTQDELDSLKEQPERQAKQIETSDKQISELHTLLDQQQKLSAQLKLQLEEVSESKKGFWNRIFNK